MLPPFLGIRPGALRISLISITGVFLPLSEYTDTITCREPTVSDPAKNGVNPVKIELTMLNFRTSVASSMGG